MHPIVLGQLAHQIGRDRLREADEHRRVIAARAHADDPPVGPLRRSMARAAAGVSRAAAHLAVRLDACTAEARLTREQRPSDA